MLTLSFGNKSMASPLQKVALWLVGITVLSIGMVGGYLYVVHAASPIPPDIRSKLTFSPIIVSSSAKNYSTTNYKFSTTEDATQILSYQIHTKDDVTIAVSEYPQPQQFSEIPEYKERFLSNIAKQYDTVQTSNGTIYLGRLERKNNQQLGILLEKGLLIFFTPNKDIDAAAWRNLGDQLEVQKMVD